MRAGTAWNPFPTFIKSVLSIIHFYGACDGPYKQSLHTAELHQNLISITHIALYHLHILQGLQTCPCCLMHTHIGTVYIVTQMPRPSSSLLPDMTWMAQSAYQMGQGWRTYGTCAQNGTRKDVVGTRHPLMSQFPYFFFPTSIHIL